MRFSIALFIVTSLGAASSLAQDSSPLIATSKMQYQIAKNNVLRSVDKLPDALWAYQPTAEVRTFGQLFAHIANFQYIFCGIASEGRDQSPDIEKTAKTKDEIVPALRQAFSYCESAYARMTDAKAAEMVDFRGRKVTRLGALDFNIAHIMEHYGNLVTYMRLNKIVPPSSEPVPSSPATGKK